ncbi:hypothetical protein NQ317_001508 [Molorchus minor]|uniref:Uncharacterized protein n=1 Tax=Molorchus minor TaxID=1323400 RepID=A0ABQ9JW77_9CUCU|nr:hypothetical protein NQ317_001508 [Molorchus minor]
MAKYGMSMCVLGMHEEFRPYNIGAIHTAATEMLAGSEVAKYSRKPDIMADAAYAILIQDPKTCTGNFFIDEDILNQAGITDLKHYASVPENADKLMPDFLVDDDVPSSPPGVPL